MSIEERDKRLRNSIDNRMIQKELDSRGTPDWVFYLALCMIPLVLFLGVWLGSNNPQFHTDFNESIEIDGVEFYFVSEEEDSSIEGRYGYTYKGFDKVWLDQQFLEKGNLEQLRETCNHELLHVYGIGTEHHGKINLFEGQITDPTCEKLVDEVTY